MAAGATFVILQIRAWISRCRDTEASPFIILLVKFEQHIPRRSVAQLNRDHGESLRAAAYNALPAHVDGYILARRLRCGEGICRD